MRSATNLPFGQRFASRQTDAAMRATIQLGSGMKQWFSLMFTTTERVAIVSATLRTHTTITGMRPAKGRGGGLRPLGRPG